MYLKSICIYIIIELTVYNILRQIVILGSSSIGRKNRNNNKYYNKNGHIIDKECHV